MRELHYQSGLSLGLLPKSLEETIKSIASFLKTHTSEVGSAITRAFFDFEAVMIISSGEQFSPYIMKKIMQQYYVPGNRTSDELYAFNNLILPERVKVTFHNNHVFAKGGRACQIDGYDTEKGLYVHKGSIASPSLKDEIVATKILSKELGKFFYSNFLDNEAEKKGFGPIRNSEMRHKNWMRIDKARDQLPFGLSTSSERQNKPIENSLPPVLREGFNRGNNPPTPIIRESQNPILTRKKLGLVVILPDGKKLSLLQVSKNGQMIGSIREIACAIRR